MAAVTEVRSKPPTSAVPKKTSTKVDKEELFKTLLGQIEAAFKTPPRELMYQGTQEVLLDGKKFILSREVNDSGDYEYKLTSLDNNVIISCSFSRDREGDGYYIVAHFKFEDKLNKINISSINKDWWRHDEGLAITANKLFRSRYTLPSLMQNGRGVKFDEKTLDTLSRIQADQDDQLMGLTKQLEIAFKTYVNDLCYKWKGIMPVRIDGKKFTLRMVRSHYDGFAFILTSEDGKIKIVQRRLENDPAYFAFSFDESLYPRGFKGDYPTNEVRTFNEEIVDHVRWHAFRQALWPSSGDQENYSTNEYEWIDTLCEVAKRENKIVGNEFEIFTSRFIDREHVKVSPVYKGAEVMKTTFQETLENILHTDRGAMHIGTTMGLTARYCLNGNLPVAQIPDFWRTAITYTNEILDAKGFSDQITEGGIEELIPLTEKDPLSQLQRLCDIKPTTSENISSPSTIQIAKIPPNPFYRLMQANSPGEVLGVIDADLSLMRMFHESKSSFAGSREPLDKILAQIPENVSSLGLNYLRAYMGDEKAFIDLTFRLLPFEHGLRLLAPILRKVEVFMDREATMNETSRLKTGMRLHHFPNLPELFLILNNQQVQKGHDLVNLATRCITSIDRFVDFGLEVDHHLVQQWAKIGLLIHGFKLWKYDTQGGENSLFSKFGFRFDSKASKDFGARYIISKQEKPELAIDDKTIIATIRGGIIAANPGWGTIFLRNSSLVFGRDLLPEPAYFSKDSLTLEEIRSIDSKGDLGRFHFKRILDPDLYKDKNFTSNLEKLLDEILKVKEAYAKRRFDPQDFKDDKNFKGDLTLGMRELISRMENKLGEIKLEISDKPLPVLGIFSSKYPPENPFAFYGSDLSLHTYLELTEEMITEIKDRLSGTWSEKKYPDSAWIRFIQSAINYNAEIVLIDPPKKQATQKENKES